MAVDKDLRLFYSYIPVFSDYMPVLSDFYLGRKAFLESLFLTALFIS